MKIAIFGDSFADDKINWLRQWQDVGPSWIDYLRQSHDIDNFSLGGSCLYYSIKIFNFTNLNAYDKVIFAVTASNRRYQVLDDRDSEHDKNWNFKSAESRMKERIKYKRQIQSIYNFFIDMFNESDEYFHELMIAHIIRTRPDVIILNHDDLQSISNQEKSFWVDKKFDPSSYLDARKCHMSEENNLILGRIIELALTEKSLNLNLNQFIDPTRNFEHYFRNL